MGKLAPLLSRIKAYKAAVKQAAADFSQGFDTGVIAGIPGMAGDWAYQVDIARRALSGQRTAPMPADFPGTTDYIAKKAGYPIPDSWAGQIGSIAGGMLTPSPSDFMKLGPLLSAIPFWHGSPHKYDAVDLSKIGTGEGAQAYGHGYYGAESRDVADAYRVDLAYNPDEMRIGGKQINKYYTEMENRAATLPPQQAAKEYDKLSVIERLMSNDPLDEVAKYADEVGVSDWFRKDVAPKYETFGNMYRGEYQWPDPAKEAATPLTGEDLLDWDKPLSEASDSVKSAIYKAIEDGKLRGGYVSGAMGERRYMPPIDWSKSGGANLDSLRYLLGPGGKAEKTLKEAGIPGIRYLDQGSRDKGQGTYNYVMFDQDGIKLLERNGKPIGKKK